MTEERDPVADIMIGFFAAMCAPAILAGVIALPVVGPYAVAIMLYVFLIALMHVTFLAIPLYWLISRFWKPGPGTVLIMAVLIGTLPLSFAISGRPTFEAWPLSLFGFVGGGAFLGFAHRGRVGEGY